MGIAELAGEYHRSVELLEDRLTQLKEEIKTARGPHYFDLKQRIDALSIYTYVGNTRLIEEKLLKYIENIIFFVLLQTENGYVSPLT